MKNLEEATEEEIEQELERRKRDKAPEPIANPDFSRLIKMTLEETEYLKKNGYPSKDFDHYVYEEVMSAIYGKGYWKWRNSLDY